MTVKSRPLVKAAQVVSLLALAGTIAPAVLFFLDRMDLGMVHTTMLLATVVWFVSAPLWMEQ